MMIATLTVLMHLTVPSTLDEPTRLDERGATVEQATTRIAWYTSWDQARAEARRTGRPILFQSAAPQCHGVPGMW